MRLENLSPWVRWGAVALLQLILIALPLAERWSVHATGQEVTLALRPVDPRDLLRGDYVILNPEIGRISRQQVAGETDLSEFALGDPVWTVVERDGEGVFRAVDVLPAPPRDGRVALKGRVGSRLSGDELRIDYGLSAFFVPQGKGLEIEAMPRETVRLVVAVSEDGRSAPLRLMADGKVLLEDSAL
ncbi:GDYXXLXY domain-containing protein [Stappia stellulata]|uniref:GDYXXLXY domain-containing protein n=1 Tax=Stappia stellulata TaxID=71235 RepID=UPI0004052429|nr:GDYXXLXY domain-containing protein [Stappia stellulata]